MKVLINCLMLLSILLTDYDSPPQKAITKHALLVGVGAYEESTGWSPLNAPNDVYLVRETLVAQGFSKYNIHLLLDEEVSKESLARAFEKKLLAKVKPGDLVVFHYSGHGQQVQDDDGDELDGLDEALVPYDSPRAYMEGFYMGEKLIRDEDLGEHFAKLRKRLGPSGHMLVILDACHSGTGVRGLGTARGTNVIMASDAWKKQWASKPVDVQQLDETEVSEDAAHMVSLFSSRARQLSYEFEAEEGKRYGLLSYAFCKYLSNIEEQMSYRGLLDKIKTFIGTHTSLQTPQLEGEGEMAVLAGNLLSKANYLQVKDWINPTTLLLSEGKAHGLHKGSKIALYPVDTRDTTGAEPLGIGEVVYTKAFSSEIELEQPLDKGKALDTWGYVTERNYGNLSVKLEIQLPENDWLSGLKERIGHTKAIQIIPEEGDLILRKKGDKIQLVNRDQYPLVEEGAPTTHQIYAACIRTAQAQYLRSLDIGGPRLKGEIKLLKNDRLVDEFRVGDEFLIEIKNVGSEAFYFNLLDIQPDNVLNVLPLSTDKRSQEEYHLESGETFTSQKMQIFEPTGTEVFKLILTPEPVDLSGVIATNGMGVRASNNNPIAVLLSETYLNHTKRGTSNLRTGAAGIYTTTFVINP